MNKEFQLLEKKIHKSNNHEICYVEYGNGPPLILLHGLGGSKADWSEIFFDLDQDFRVIAIDFPGFGASSPPPINLRVDYSYFSSVLNEFINSTGFDKVHLVGNSLGGGVTIHQAINFPLNVKSISLISSSGIGRGVNLEIRLFSLRWLVKKKLVETSKEDVLTTWRYLIPDPNIPIKDRVDLTWEWIQKPETQDFIMRTYPQAANLCGQKNLFTKDLNKIKIPTLVTWGEMDNVIPLKHAYIAHSLIPNSTIHILKNSGHLIHIEKAKIFADFLLSHLQKV